MQSFLTREMYEIFGVCEICDFRDERESENVSSSVHLERGCSQQEEHATRVLHEQLQNCDSSWPLQREKNGQKTKKQRRTGMKRESKRHRKRDDMGWPIGEELSANKTTFVVHT